MRLWCALLSGMLALQGCKEAAADGNTGFSTVDSSLHREWHAQNIHAIDSATALLKTGDLALRIGADATSHMLRNMNQSNKTFSHCGIVVVEGGKPYIYHSIGGEDNPDAKIRRDPPAVFFSAATNTGLGIVRLDLPPATIARMVDTAVRYWTEARSFDMDFDLETDDQLYCAEYVSKTVQRAANDPHFFNTSSLGGFKYVAVDNLYENPHATTICSIRYK